MTRHWERVESPVETALYGVTDAACGVVAAGDAGRLCRRTDRGRWRLALDGGPDDEGAPLRAIDATADGDRVWVGGDDGTLAAYDATDSTLTPASQPPLADGDVLALAVAGGSGDERVFAATDDGTVAVGGPGDPWTRRGVAPDAVVDLAVRSPRVCVAVTPTTVYRTRDAGETWTATRPRRDPEFTAVTTSGGRLWAGGRDGRVHRYDRRCDVWTTAKVTDVDLAALAPRRDAPLCVGDAGVVARGVDHGWTDRRTADADLHAVTARGRVVAVGDDGSVLESPREALV